MVIHDQGYRALQYEPQPTWVRLLPLARLEFSVLFRRKLGQSLFFLCLLPCVFQLLVHLWRSGMVELGGIQGARALAGEIPGLDPANRRFYLDPILSYSRELMLVLTALVSCRAIAKDRAAGALELLWTRGITPAQYFLGKWLGSLWLLGIPCVVGPLVLWLYAVLNAPDWTLLERTIVWMPQAVLGLTFFAVVISFLALLFSAMAAGPNVATLFWLVLMGGSFAASRFLSVVFRGQDWWRSLYPFDSTARIARWIAGHEGIPGATWPVGVAWIGLLLCVALFGLPAWRRLRLSEAIP